MHSLPLLSSSSRYHKPHSEDMPGRGQTHNKRHLVSFLCKVGPLSLVRKEDPEVEAVSARSHGQKAVKQRSEPKTKSSYPLPFFTSSSNAFLCPLTTAIPMSTSPTQLSWPTPRPTPPGAILVHSTGPGCHSSAPPLALPSSILHCGFLGLRLASFQERDPLAGSRHPTRSV